MDKDLGRYMPLGFTGSFTPRPFRPALAEYAVRAAREDPNFWGMEWTQLPDSRCEVCYYVTAFGGKGGAMFSFSVSGLNIITSLQMGY